MNTIFEKSVNKQLLIFIASLPVARSYEMAQQQDEMITWKRALISFHFAALAK